MSGRVEVSVVVNAREANAKLERIAEVCGKGLDEVLRDHVRLFVKKAILNTMPMMLSTKPSAAKNAWQTRVQAHYEKKRQKGFYTDSSLRKLLARKKRELGREAAGWNAAATALGTKGVPAWVKRHGAGEGSFRERKSGDRVTIAVTNSVPYNETMTRRRAKFALDQLTGSLDWKLKAMKARLKRRCK